MFEVCVCVCVYVYVYVYVYVFCLFMAPADDKVHYSERVSRTLQNVVKRSILQKSDSD